MARPVRAWVSAALINRNYGLFMIGTTISGTGYWFLLVALGWIVLELGNSTFLLGLTNFAQMAPLFFLGLLGGVAADRFNRRTIMLIGQLVAIVSMLVLAVLASIGLISIPVILLCSLVFGLANAILWPTWSVFIKDLVGAEHLRHAVALNAARFNLTRVVGPVLAGVALGTIGPAWCLWIAAITSVGTVATILMMRLPAWQPRPHSGASIAAQLGQALVFVWRAPAVRRLLVIAGLMGLVAMPFQTFLPALARDTLMEGPEVLGLLTAAVGVGAMLGAFISGSRLATRHPAGMLIALAAGVATGLGLLAVSTAVWLAMAALAILGLATIAFLSMANASVQLGVPEELVGRVMGLWVVLNAGTQPLGSLLEGGMAERWGLGPTFGLAAAASAVVVVWLLWEQAGQRLTARSRAIEPR